MDTSARNFTRRVEDFICEHCGTPVTGNGFTNHCPQCLYSKHVDVLPGDREESCGGLMRPIHIEPFETSFKILHRCECCGHERKNRVAPVDNFDNLLGVVERETKTNTKPQ